jgi:hypothetical protein
MSPLASPLPLVPAPPPKRIVLEFTPSAVGGELTMALSYTGIPEGWAFVHQVLCDALKQVGQEWVKSQQAVMLPPDGVRH